jgi:predicted dinucleotide-binding enzyme
MDIGIIGSGQIGSTLARVLGRPVLKAFNNIVVASLASGWFHFSLA